MSTIRTDAPNTTYIDAFLQGARFALFALEGRLSDKGEPVPIELEAALDEFHDLYSSTRSGLEVESGNGEPLTRYVGRN